MVLNKYKVGSFVSPLLAYAAYVTDEMFACPAILFDRDAAKFTTVYAYEFQDRAAPFAAPPTPEIPSYGAFHAAELQYIFQTDLGFENPANFTQEQRNLSDEMMRAWALFAKNGSPNGAGPNGNWEKFSAGSDSIRAFGTSGGAASNFYIDHKCSFWTK